MLVAPHAADSQQAGKVYRIAAFHVGLDHVPPSLDGLRDGLKALGYEEGVPFPTGVTSTRSIPPSLLLRADQVIE